MFVFPGEIESIEACVEYNIPICATEVFSIAQAIMICEKYESAVIKFVNKPPFYVTHISGIFDEYLKKNASRNCINIASEVINMAGLTVARKQYRIMKVAVVPFKNCSIDFIEDMNESNNMRSGIKSDCALIHHFAFCSSNIEGDIKWMYQAG